MKQATPALFLLLFAVLFLATGPAQAGCTNPTGNESDQVYNKDYHTMQFCNGTTWMSMSGGGAGSGPMSLISTQTASASASLQFTNLPTSYNTLFLTCSLVEATDNASLEMQFGESTGPTWKTSNYNYYFTYYSSAGTGGNTAASASNIYLSGGSSNLAGYTQVADIYIHNIASSSLYKSVNGTYGNEGNAANGFFVGLLGGQYFGDTNTITAIKVFYSSGNITSGTCSLYGMN